MLSVTYTAALSGVEAFLITIECSAARGIPSFEIVGLPDMAVKESIQRITTGAESSGINLPDADIKVNLAPADVRKEGSALDMGILASVCCATGLLGSLDLEDYCFFGELSFTGDIRRVRGCLNMVLAAAKRGKRRIFVPHENLVEASAAAGGGVKVYGVKTAAELISHLKGEALIAPVEAPPEKLQNDTVNIYGDFSQIKGQTKAKRAVEIAAAGGHNILLVGPPGSGKSMIAKRIPTILPELSYAEAIETTKVHSASGLIDANCGLIAHRPFRSPHHSMSVASLVGGGKIPMPGEISLAHNGVLFLDEFPEFNKGALESLRAPLEDAKVTITRAAGRMTFPSAFMMVCAMNPCKCGYYGSRRGTCTCSPGEVKAYLSKLSGPMLDRIDIQVEMPELDFTELSGTTPSECSADIRARVEKAREYSRERFRAIGVENYSVMCNAKLDTDSIRRFCELDASCLAILESSFKKMNLSARAYDRILRVARTIADIDAARKNLELCGELSGGKIEKKHIMEAVQMRSLDKYFK